MKYFYKIKVIDSENLNIIIIFIKRLLHFYLKIITKTYKILFINQLNKYF
jgi:hypothetical protein